jgi:thiol-disulfide isomerase/thioredoxin
MIKNYLLLFTLISYITSFSQTIVSTDSENKKVILEEYTGIHCTYCPDGHEIAQSLKDQYPDDVLLINIQMHLVINKPIFIAKKRF